MPSLRRMAGFCVGQTAKVKCYQPGKSIIGVGIASMTRGELNNG
ncbi:MAG: hypothetical protein WCP20_10870 [Desulfuromonadales bacterium]